MLLACASCGGKVSDKADACPHCRADHPTFTGQRRLCVECEASLAMGARVCSECGAPALETASEFVEQPSRQEAVRIGNEVGLQTTIAPVTPRRQRSPTPSLLRQPTVYLSVVFALVCATAATNQSLALADGTDQSASWTGAGLMGVNAIAGLRAAVIRESQSSAWDFVLGLFVGLFLLAGAGWIVFGAFMLLSGAWSVQPLQIATFLFTCLLAASVFYRLLLMKGRERGAQLASQTS
jgi:hypothetical protein